MFDLRKALFGTPQYVSRTDTTVDSLDPDPNDIWALTDPDARDEYARRNAAQQFEHDVRFEVMRGGPWTPEELAYKSEIRRLLREGALIDKGSYWYVSPHPTVYRALRDGVLSIGGHDHRFRAGDDIVFQCRMERDKETDDLGPVLVAQLQPADQPMLCGEMQEAMKGMGKQSRSMGKTM
jgi:hypothetical protein